MNKIETSSMKLLINGTEIKPVDCNISYNQSNTYKGKVVIYLNQDGVDKLKDFASELMKQPKVIKWQTRPITEYDKFIDKSITNISEALGVSRDYLIADIPQDKKEYVNIIHDNCGKPCILAINKRYKHGDIADHRDFKHTDNEDVKFGEKLVCDSCGEECYIIADEDGKLHAITVKK